MRSDRQSKPNAFPYISYFEQAIKNAFFHPSNIRLYHVRLTTYDYRIFSKIPKASSPLPAKINIFQCTAIAVTPGWLRSELMLDRFGISEANWQDATTKEPHFIISETPHYIGRAVAHLAGDLEVARWNGRSLESGQLAQIYGFTDLDGSQLDAWRYIRQVQELGKPADATGYR